MQHPQPSEDRINKSKEANSGKNQFFHDLNKLESLTAKGNQTKGASVGDREEDIKDPMERMIRTKDRSECVPDLRGTGASRRGRANRRSRKNRGNFRGRSQSSCFSGRYSHFRGSQHFSPHRNPPSGWGRGNPTNYYDSDFESDQSDFGRRPLLGCFPGQPSSFFRDARQFPTHNFFSYRGRGKPPKYYESDSESDQSDFRQRPLLGCFPGQSSCSVDSRQFPTHRNPFGGQGRTDQIGNYESDLESLKSTSSLGYLTSVSQQTSVPVTPCLLARTLVELANYEATLLILLDQHQLNHKEVRQTAIRYPETFEMQVETVLLRPKLAICPRYLGEEGCPAKKTCQDVHLCLQHLGGRCTKGADCIYGHNISTDHNKPLLNRFHLNTIPLQLLLGLLKFLHDDSLTVTEDIDVCDAYNLGNCTDDKCTNLHLCLKFLAKSCSSDGKCKLNHMVFESQPSTIMKCHGISLNESPRDILMQVSSSICIKKKLEALQLTSPQSGNQEEVVKLDSAAKKDSPVDKPTTLSKEAVPLKTTWYSEFIGKVTRAEICYDSVEGLCPYEASGCWRLHSDSHFNLQGTSSTSAKKSPWFNLTKEQSLALEIAYCDPNIDKTPLPPIYSSNLSPSTKGLLIALGGRSKWEADFKAMKLIPCEGNEHHPLNLRRLCTEDCSTKPMTPEACKFKWYFFDKNKKWIEYGQVDSAGEEKLKSSISSDDIEKFAQQNSRDSVMQFTNQEFTYLLDLQNMTQTNLSTNVSRQVRRRPQPHLMEEKKSLVGSATKDDLPISWDPMKPDERVRRVVLSSSSSEYQTVLNHVQSNGGGSINVTQIERVQNPYLWRAFQNKVQEMTSLYKDATIVNVRQLFHGTNPDTVPKICEENFDWRLHGTNVGQAMGRGTYFSPFASTSHGYTRPDTNNARFMFIARVAVGTITTGNSSMTRPPLNPLYQVPFDATANATQNPSIIVKYDKQEYFPEYILTMT